MASVAATFHLGAGVGPPAWLRGASAHDDSGRFVPLTKTGKSSKTGIYDPTVLLWAHSLISVGRADGTVVRKPTCTGHSLRGKFSFSCTTHLAPCNSRMEQMSHAFGEIVLSPMISSFKRKIFYPLTRIKLAFSEFISGSRIQKP